MTEAAQSLFETLIRTNDLSRPDRMRKMSLSKNVKGETQDYRVLFFRNISRLTFHVSRGL